MIRAALIAAVLSGLAAPALAADERAPIPAELHAAWAREGHCNKASERLEVSAYRAGWGDGHSGGVHFDGVRRAIVWDDESNKEYFALGPRGLQLFHVAKDGERERLVKCPGRLIGRRR